MPSRSYSSSAPAPGGVEDTSTEGITFDLDGVTFTCHGRLSAYDLSEFAGPAMDGDVDGGDPGALRVLAEMLRALMGEATYRAFMKHRRAHQTPDSVVQQVTGGIIEDVTSRPTSRPSTSPGGPEPTAGSSPAISPSPGKQPAQWVITGQYEREQETIPADVAKDGDVTFLPVPAGGVTPEPENPMGVKTRRVINLGDAARTRVEPLTG